MRYQIAQYRFVGDSLEPTVDFYPVLFGSADQAHTFFARTHVRQMFVHQSNLAYYLLHELTDDLRYSGVVKDLVVPVEVR